MEEESYRAILMKTYMQPVDFSEYEDIIMEPLNYLAQKPHKTFQKFIHAANYWFKLSPDQLKYAEETLQLCINATTTLDDIVDDGKIARGEPAPHTVYGVPATLMSCEFANYKFLRRVLDLNDKDYLKCSVECAMNAFKGQAVEIYWRENSICPTFEEYVMLNNAKATCYFFVSLGFMQALSTNKKDYSRIMALSGIFFQFRNDYRNLFMPEDNNNFEVYADDLTEGKFSLPLVHAISTLKNEEVAEILKLRPKDLETKRRCVKILKEIGSQKYCLDLLNETAATIKKEIRNFDENPLMELSIDIACDFNYWTE